MGVRELPDSTDQNVTVNIPTLVLSGDLDVATPAFRSQLVVDKLPNATHVVFPGHTHVQLGQFNQCAADVFTQFIADQAAALDTSCLEETNVVGFLLPDGTFSLAP
jgi:pimeloyl-ACP methyl ester carboxylesterase